MILLWLFIIGAIMAAAFALAVVFAFYLLAMAVLTVGLGAAYRGLTGHWPSAEGVTWVAGLTFTFVLLAIAGANIYVFAGGILGTWLAARTASS